MALLLFVRAKPYQAKQDINYCQVYGSIYIESNIEMADYSIFIQPEEAFADLVAYKTDDALYASANGLWYITNQKAFADHIIYFSTTESNADFSVYFTDNESFVGCK